MIRAFGEAHHSWKDWGLGTWRMFGTAERFGDLELMPGKELMRWKSGVNLLDGQSKELTSEKSRAINTILENTPGWEHLTHLKYFGPHGRQRGFYNTGFPSGFSVGYGTMERIEQRYIEI